MKHCETCGGPVCPHCERVCGQTCREALLERLTAMEAELAALKAQPQTIVYPALPVRYWPPEPYQPFWSITTPGLPKTGEIIVTCDTTGNIASRVTDAVTEATGQLIGAGWLQQ